MTAKVYIDGFYTVLAFMTKYADLMENPLVETLPEDEAEDYIHSQLKGFIDMNPEKVLFAVCEGYLEMRGEYWEKDPSPSGMYNWTDRLPKPTAKWWNEAFDKGLASSTTDPCVMDVRTYEAHEHLKPVISEYRYD